MKLVTTIGFRQGWLRRMIHYCCRELDFPPDRLRKATFSLSHSGSFKGKAYHHQRLIIVRLNPLLQYPYRFRNKKRLPEFEVADAIELAVYLTAHEIAHLRFPDHTESPIEVVGRNVALDFRRRREQLLPRWGDPGPGPVHQGKVHRWECRRCGHVSRSARRGRNPERRSCGSCYKSWSVAAAVGDFLSYSTEQAGVDE